MMWAASTTNSPTPPPPTPAFDPLWTLTSQTYRTVKTTKLPPGVSALGIHRSDQVLAGIRRNSIGSILEAGCRPSRESATPSSPLHQESYRMRETGCVGHMLQQLNLPPLQERRRQQRPTTLYNIVKGHIPAMPPENFLTPADRSWRRICPTTFNLRIAVMTTPLPDKKFKTLVIWRFQTARLSSTRTHSS